MADAPQPSPPLVDWARAGRRLRASALTLVGVALAGWLVAGVLRGEVVLEDLGDWVGLAVAGMFVVELVVVGGSALRGMLRAGDRGERLAHTDVGLLPAWPRRPANLAANEDPTTAGPSDG